MGDSTKKAECTAFSDEAVLLPDEWSDWTTDLEPGSSDLVVAEHIRLCIKDAATISWDLSSFTGMCSNMRLARCALCNRFGPKSMGRGKGHNSVWPYCC